jgi:hypothetical protein
MNCPKSIGRTSDGQMTWYDDQVIRLPVAILRAK